MPRKSPLRRLGTAFSTAIVWTTAPLGLAAPITEVLVWDGDPVPGIDATFATLGTPALSESGTLAFTASIDDDTPTDTDDRVVCTATRYAIRRVIRSDDLIGGEALASFDHPSIDAAGRLVFREGLFSGNTFGIYRRSFPGAPVESFVLDGGSVPEGTYTVGRPANGPATNAAGQLAVPVTLSGTAGGSTDNHALLFIDAPGSAPVVLAQKGQAPPEGNGVLGDIGGTDCVLNDLGAVAFKAGLTGTASYLNDDVAIYRAQPGGPLTKLWRAGDPVPGGGTFRPAVSSGPAFNNAGEVAFIAKIEQGLDDSVGVFRSSGSLPTEIIRGGDVLPGTGGPSYSLGRTVALNDAGQVVFEGSVDSQTPGLFRGEGGASSLRKIFIDGDPLPGGVGTFIVPRNFALNPRGQVAFSAGTSLGNGIFLYDDMDGLTTIALVGQPFMSSTFTSVSFSGSAASGGQPSYSGTYPAGRHGFNDAGQVAFSFSLADGRRGIALWSPEELLIDANATIDAGSATVTRDGASFPLGPGDPVFEGDRIETGEGEAITLLFADGTSIALNENTVIVVEGYLFDPEALDGNRSEFSLVRGLFVFVSGLIGQRDPEDVRIRAGAFGVGIRGTEFSADLEVTEDTATITVEVTRGAVDLTDLWTGLVHEVIEGASLQLGAPAPSLATVRYRLEQVGGAMILKLSGYTDRAFTVQHSTDLAEWDDGPTFGPSDLPVDVDLSETSSGSRSFIRLSRDEPEMGP